MNNLDNDLHNCRKLLALLGSTFKGATFGGEKMENLLSSVRRLVEVVESNQVADLPKVNIRCETSKIKQGGTT